MGVAKKEWIYWMKMFIFLLIRELSDMREEKIKWKIWIPFLLQLVMWFKKLIFSSAEIKIWEAWQENITIKKLNYV